MFDIYSHLDSSNKCNFLQNNFIVKEKFHTSEIEKLIANIKMEKSKAIIIAVSLIFIPIIKNAEKDLGKDSKKIVIDEIIGYFVAILFLPHSPEIAIYALVLFRVFDVAKSPPINRLQRLPPG